MNLSTYWEFVSSELTLVHRFLERITSGDIEVTADQFPNFIYNEDKADELSAHDPDDWDVEKGLLQSPLCLWVRALNLNQRHSS